MLVKIKRMDSGCECYEISSADILVSELKKLIEEKHAISSDRIRLIYTGRVLNDEETLASYSISDDSVIHMVVRPQSVPDSQPSVGAEPPHLAIPNTVPMEVRDLGNGVFMGSVTIDGGSGASLTDAINQMMGLSQSIAASASQTSRGPPPAQIQPPSSPNSDIVMASAFLNVVDRLCRGDHSYAQSSNQDSVDSVSALLFNLMNTLHGLQMLVLRLSQDLDRAERK